jgi:hypothetical protein
MDKKSASKALTQSVQKTSGDMARNEIISKIARARLANLLAKNKDRIPKLAGDKTDKLPTDTIKRFLAKKLDTHLGEASIDYVTPELRHTAAKIYAMQKGGTPRTTIKTVGNRKFNVDDYVGTIKSRDPKSRSTRVVHVSAEPGRHIGTAGEGAYSMHPSLADFRVNPKKMEKMLKKRGVDNPKWNPHYDVSSHDLRHLDRTHSMRVPKLDKEGHGATTDNARLSPLGHQATNAHELMHIHDPAIKPGYGKRKRVFPANAPMRFAQRTGRYPNFLDNIFPHYRDMYQTSREETHTYSGIAGTYGVERIKSGGYSGQEARDMLRKVSFPEHQRNVAEPVPTPHSLKPKTRLGRELRRLKAGLTPGGYKAFAGKEREKHQQIKAQVVARNRQRSASDPTFGNDVLDMIAGPAGAYKDYLGSSKRQHRRKGQKFFKEVHKGMEREYGADYARKGKLPEEEEPKSVPSKFVRLKNPKMRPRSTDAALTEAVKKRIRDRVSVNVAPLDSAGDVGWGGPTGRTAHENL